VRFSFGTRDLVHLYVHGSNQYHPNLVKAFRRVIDIIAAAPDERTLRGMKGLRMEKLHGDREGQYSVRLNDQYRLIFSVLRDEGGNYLLILDVVDYH
jgi:proteic killer suppression protein